MRLTFGLVALSLTACEPLVLKEISVVSLSGLKAPSWPVESELAPADTKSALPSEATARYRIVAEPEVLQVYRSTSVKLSLETMDGAAPPEGATCLWNLGDGSAPRQGCEIEHTFIGGSADERFSASLEVQGNTFELNHIIPLERLPVTRVKVTSHAIPAAPQGEQAFRAIFVSDTQELDEEELRLLAGRIQALEPALVFHLGGLTDEDSGSEGQTRFRQTFMEPLRAANIPLILSPAPEDLEAQIELRPPLTPKGEPFELIGAEAYPERFAFAFRGVFFALVSGADQEREGLNWLRTRLNEAQIYSSRLVLSYLPLHPFSAEGAGALLGPKFKVYELLLKSRVTALISAAHQTYFKGRYGALSVLSVGSPSRGGSLLGYASPQAPSFVVMDVEGGVPAQIFALTSEGGEPFAQPFDESYLPDTVEVYTR